MKKMLIFVLALSIVIGLVGCTGGKKDKDDSTPTVTDTEKPTESDKETSGSSNLEGSLSEIIDKLYTSIDFDKSGTIITEITAENSAAYFGTEVEFEEAAASEYEFGGAYSLCLLRTKDGADIEAIKKSIDEKADMNKWVCMTAEAKAVESNGDVILLIMATNDQVTEIAAAFKELKN